MMRVFFPSFSDRASAIIIYYVVKRVVEQRDSATRDKSLIVSSVLIATREKGGGAERGGEGERQASRPAYHRLRVSRETASYAVTAH